MPQLFTIEIDEYLASRIRRLADSVRELDTFAIEEPNYSGTWSKESLQTRTIGIDDASLCSMVDQLERAEIRVKNPTLRVTRDGFSFTAISHNPDCSSILSTPSLKLRVLDNPEPLVSVH